MPDPLRANTAKYLYEYLKETFDKMIEAYPYEEGAEYEEARVEFYARASGSISLLTRVIDIQAQRISTLEEQVERLMQQDKRKGIDE